VSTQGHSFFLVIEGMDGSGKTTIARRLADSLKALQFNVYLTFQPHDGSAAGIFIRDVLTKKIKVSPKTLALAFALNRLDHGATVIEPCLVNPHTIVICDRYYLSSLVYQTSQELPIERVMFLSEGAQPPDLTLYLDASAATCIRRMQRRSALSAEPREQELFEDKLDATREKYQQAIAFLRQRGESIEIVDANDDDPANVLREIVAALAQYTPDWLSQRLAEVDTNVDSAIQAEQV
jgi:dTMP kinase